MAMIYKLYSISNPLIYIGSTTKPLQVRLANHIISWNAFKTNLIKSKLSSYEIIDSGEYGIELLEECDINNRYIREQYFIDLIPCCNKNSAYTGITGNQKTKESWAAYQRAHYKLNRHAHLSRKLSYYYRNKETIKNKRQIKKRFEELPFYV